MNAIALALRAIADRLEASGRPWALVGGFAVSARAEPRTTRDVDLAVAVRDDAEAEALIHDLQSSGAYALVSVVEQTRTKRLATARLRPTSSNTRRVLVDLLFASSGIEPEVAAAGEVLEVLPGLALPVARIGHLIALKVLARDDRYRPQDLDDLRALLARASEVDLEEARRAVEAIERRGFHRGRHLATDLEALIAGRDAP